MKLKYKKLAVAISVGTICIGGIAFTIVNQSGKGHNHKAKHSVSVTDDSFSEDSKESEDMEVQKNAYPEINELIKEYFAARVACDIDKLGTLVSNVDNVKEEELKTLGTYVEGYENIDVYTVAAQEKDSYVALAYTDIKLKDIKTPAPGLTALYVNKDENGNYVIFNGVLSDEQNAYRESVYKCEGVKELIGNVQKKYKEALASDEDLNAFYNQAKKEEEEKNKDMPDFNQSAEDSETSSQAE
ncbi:hypothetical protein [[Clostridium] polysaccharolyticum]|uniref:hypothetical protein n=1 Tax=[Clostridium] polysaccharolyticum TaxID=29364 RepID=UPI000B81BAC8|nr:hypothetical protein [[Clostridium] polysaccharolyticum]